MTDANNTSVIFIPFCSHKDFLFPLTVSTLYAGFFPHIWGFFQQISHFGFKTKKFI